MKSNGVREPLDQQEAASGTVKVEQGVPGRGLEPLRIAPPDPKSDASANFATPARRNANNATGVSNANNFVGPKDQRVRSNRATRMGVYRSSR